MTPSNPNIPYGYCQCGCGKPTSISPWTDRHKGYVGGIPRPFILGHNNAKSKVLFDYEDRGYISCCWIWRRSISGSGYGRYRRSQAHRAFYEMIIGEIPVGLVLDHLCRQRACVNPHHLEPVTELENIRRGIAGDVNRKRLSSQMACRNGHAFDEQNTLTRMRDGVVGRRCRKCMKIYDRRSKQKAKTNRGKP